MVLDANYDSLEFLVLPSTRFLIQESDALALFNKGERISRCMPPPSLSGPVTLLSPGPPLVKCNPRSLTGQVDALPPAGPQATPTSQPAARREAVRARACLCGVLGERSELVVRGCFRWHFRTPITVIQPKVLHELS